MSLKKIVYAGLDVDDTAFYAAGLVLDTGGLYEFKCKPDNSVRCKKLKYFFVNEYLIHLCQVII